MSKASGATAPHKQSVHGYKGAFAEIGDYTVAFEEYSEDVDLAPLLVGLPDDRCQARHWGYVIRGKVAYKMADGTVEEIGAGEAYYVRPGHTPLLHSGTEVVEFSTTAELAPTMEVVLRNSGATPKSGGAVIRET
jgi:hypothetical protein